MPAVLVALVLGAVAAFELAATFRVMWLDGHGHHRPRAVARRFGQPLQLRRA